MPTVRFVSSGRVMFNAAAARLLRPHTHVRILFDKDTDRIAFEPTDEGDAFSYKITDAPSQAIVTAAGVADRYSIPRGQRMRIEWDEKTSAFIAQIDRDTKPGERRAVVL